MEEWLALVEGALGCKDFKVLLQVPAGKHAKVFCEALLYGGFDQLLGTDKDAGAVESVKVDRIKLRGAKLARSHCLISVKGMVKNGQLINDFFVYVQVPKTADENDLKAVEAMASGKGLVAFLGRFVKKITFARMGETGVGAFEQVSAGVIV